MPLLDLTQERQNLHKHNTFAVITSNYIILPSGIMKHEDTLLEKMVTYNNVQSMHIYLKILIQYMTLNYK